jgi:hypothetical protein
LDTKLGDRLISLHYPWTPSTLTTTIFFILYPSRRRKFFDASFVGFGTSFVTYNVVFLYVGYAIVKSKFFVSIFSSGGFHLHPHQLPPFA